MNGYVTTEAINDITSGRPPHLPIATDEDADEVRAFLKSLKRDDERTLGDVSESGVDNGVSQQGEAPPLSGDAQAQYSKGRTSHSRRFLASMIRQFQNDEVKPMNNSNAIEMKLTRSARLRMRANRRIVMTMRQQSVLRWRRLPAKQAGIDKETRRRVNDVRRLRFESTVRDGRKSSVDADGPLFFARVLCRLIHIEAA